MEIRNIPLGDLHFGKRTLLVETETERYILKPRSYKTEEAWSRFCKGLAELGLCAFSRSPDMLFSSEGGHAEEIIENRATDRNGISAYYYRAGILLFFAYLLFSSDLHCENIIAEGDMPVIVDMETLLGGKISRLSGLNDISRSVMCSHLLCNFAEKNGETVDVSGFSGGLAEKKNIPHTEGGRVMPWEMIDELILGFGYAYGFCMAHRSELEKLIHLFDGCLFRQILRPTGTYSAITKYLLQADEDKREALARELLLRAYKNDIDKNRAEQAMRVVEEEKNAVLAGEIPLFHVLGNGTDLLCGEKTVFEGHLELSPVDYAVERLYALCERDLNTQLAIIMQALSASTPIEKAKNVNINTGASAPGEICGRIVSKSEIPELPSAFCSLASGKNGVAFTSCGFGLYSGLTGVMCMYAALYRRTEKKKYKELLSRYFERFCKAVSVDERTIVLNDRNASLGDGVTGMISALLHIFELTEDKSFAEKAEMMISRLTLSEHIKNIDYLNGIGALPLLLLKREMDTSALAEKFSELFSSATPYTTGAAHGAAGLALAVCALKALYGGHIMERNALDIIKWENSQFSEADGNWYDLRDPEVKGFMSGWCSGAPGIGMARRKLCSLTLDESLRNICLCDIERAERFLFKKRVSKRDTLCCGSAARLMAASCLGVRTDELYNELTEKEQSGALKLFHPVSTADVNVSLMQGFSGVAYALAMYGDPLSGGMLI